MWDCVTIGSETNEAQDMTQGLPAWLSKLGIFLVAILLVIGLTAIAANAATLKVEVENIRSTKGSVHLALWDRSESFTKGDLKIAGAKVPADLDGVLEFKDLKPGQYALAVYHDENDNGKFDRTWIGLPAEGLGFSNGAWISLGPPSFDDAAVEFDGSEKTIKIALRY